MLMVSVTGEVISTCHNKKNTGEITMRMMSKLVPQ